MGAGASSIAGPDGDGWYRPGLGDLPEACVASVLLHLDPPEICRVARLNRAFRGAASADFVWETKLPSNYGYLLEKLAQGEDGAGHQRRRRGKRLGKKEIYASLCHPNPFDGGTKMFWLEKYKGGVCMSISSKALSITGIDDRRYWNYIPTEESRRPRGTDCARLSPTPTVEAERACTPWRHLCPVLAKSFTLVIDDWKSLLEASPSWATYWNLTSRSNTAYLGNN